MTRGADWLLFCFMERTSSFRSLRCWKTGAGFALLGEEQGDISSFPRLTQEGVGNLNKSATSLKRSPTRSYLTLEDDKLTFEIKKGWH
ncbi:hypothetical protein IX91_03985 [Vibrio tubiashii ATCC 19109]|uniref:Uncharacterized protein n=1 Tax=Vibrio tubiashii ATCC 19109 TaxID=1051646 RepID=F9T0P2_9VIBR|nr:hypothetical protein IX91_03985 [Vibrio tubiashii ATCC 19109]EGU58668.1 hypothetical protein VITU9109_19280 [Vibrio tubiashii ATCC 19109]EIF01594.1 hypothetical protein VT1337_22829 [Vibrio tubiashii NCIMB 1337 = ATCC 19106]